jgi:hypothetical protein
MKFRWIAAALVAVLALAAGCVAYLCVRDPLPAVASAHGDALLWLRHEFNLPPDKMARIEAMHAAYQTVCDEHCRQIRESRAGLRQLQASSAPEAEIAAATARDQELDLLCRTSLQGHMREVAGVIGGADGERYLAIVLPRIATFDHSGAPPLDLDTADPHAGHAHH